jgi:hypothetical protein
MRVKAFYPLSGVITMPRPMGVDFLLFLGFNFVCNKKEITFAAKITMGVP